MHTRTLLNAGPGRGGLKLTGEGGLLGGLTKIVAGAPLEGDHTGTT